MAGAKQHTTPRCLLRGFADDGLIVKFDLRSGRAYRPQPIKEVGYHRHIYTVTDYATGERSSSAIDDWIWFLEDAAAPVLQRFREGEANLEDAELGALANFVALQLYRVPAARALWQENEASLDRLRPYVDGLPPAFRGHDGANAKMSLLVDQAWPVILRRFAVQVMRFEEPYLLLTSDVPVVLVPDPRRGSLVSVKTARTIAFGVGHQTALIYTEYRPGVAHQVVVDGTREFAQALNQLVVQQSQRQVFWHPSATVDELVGSGFEFPDYRNRVAPASVDTHAEKIARWAKWTTENPDLAAQQAHPVLPSRSMPAASNDG